MKEELDFDDILLFPKDIITQRIDESILIISVNTANWLVFNDEHQLTLFDMLRRGESIGEIAEKISSENEMNQFKSVLAAISARKFAGIMSLPQIEYLQGYKMLNIYLTNACNLRCKHCFMNAGVRLKDELGLNEWKKVLEDFKNEGGACVTFSGGEPVMNKDFGPLLKFTHNLGLKITVLSNGLLWSEEMIEEFAEFIDEIQFSLDGVNEENNAKVRGKGNFEKVIDTIVKFSCMNVKTSVATTFTYENLKEDTQSMYKELVENIRSRASNDVFFKLSKKLLAGRNVSTSREQNENYSKRIKEIEAFVNPNADFENFMMGHTPNLVAKNCGLGGISISADGNVFFCNRIHEVDNYGSVKNKPISFFMNIGKDINSTTSVDKIEPCSNCSLRYICNGGCRIDDFNFAGKVKGTEEKFKQITCNEDKKLRLKKKMIDSYNYYYEFNE